MVTWGPAEPPMAIHAHDAAIAAQDLLWILKRENPVEEIGKSIQEAIRHTAAGTRERAALVAAMKKLRKVSELQKALDDVVRCLEAAQEELARRLWREGS